MQKSKRPLVTVGIPVYNDERYVSIAVSDILVQTYDNLEIVISDNSSSDRTGAICLSYAAKDSRIRYVRQERNLGPLKNFKYLIANASGEYFMWAASDDRWHPEFIERLIEPLEREPDVVVAFCAYSEIDENGSLLPGVYSFDFGGSSAAWRITKFNMEPSGRRDAFFYGLFRRRGIVEIEFNKWWWFNKNIPMNLACPILSYILAAGNYHLVDFDQSLWLNRIHLNSKPRHSAELSSWPRLFSYLAFLLRKLNQLYETEKAVMKGSGSLLTGIMVFPVLIIRCLYDCLLQTCQTILGAARRLQKSN